MKNAIIHKKKRSKRKKYIIGGNTGGYSNLKEKKIYEILKSPPIIKKTKKCTPFAKKNQPSNLTCIPKSIMQQLKHKYNEKYPKHKIEATNPFDIWKSLNVRLQCNLKEKDDCFLNLLTEKEKKIIADKIYSPNAPKEWKNNPNEWLSNFDIEAIMKDYEESYKNFHYIATPPIDFAKKIPFECVEPKLCKISLEKEKKNGKLKLGIIFNLDVHTGSGTHWTSFFCDISQKYIFYFDSAGNEMPPEIKKFIDKLVKQGKEMGIDFTIYTNGTHTHQKSNTECGMYSLFFIITQLTEEIEYAKKNNKNEETNEIIKLSFDEKIKLFTEMIIPDEYVEKYRKLYFNLI